MTVGQLKNELANLPDDMPVLIPVDFCDRYGTIYGLACSTMNDHIDVEPSYPGYEDIDSVEYSPLRSWESKYKLLEAIKITF